MRVNRGQLSALLGVSGTAVTKWLRIGLPIARPGARGRAAEYDLGAVLAWLRQTGAGQTIRGGAVPIDLDDVERRAGLQKRAATAPATAPPADWPAFGRALSALVEAAIVPAGVAALRAGLSGDRLVDAMVGIGWFLSELEFAAGELGHDENQILLAGACCDLVGRLACPWGPDDFAAARAELLRRIRQASAVHTSASDEQPGA
ncbi:MAG: hypothetical protein ACOZDY_08875 [Pseudomonadota bacterium]